MAAATVNSADVLPDLDRWIQPASKDLIYNKIPRCYQIPHAQKFTIAATSNDDAGDIVRLFKAPGGAYIWSWRSTPTDMDTGGSPALVYSIVATDDSDVVKLTLVSGSTNGQAAAGSDSLLAAAHGKYVGGYWISYKVTTGAATAAAGTLDCSWMLSIGVVNRSERGTFMGNASA